MKPRFINVCRLHRNYSTQLTKKPRILIVGAGWGGYRLAQDIEKTRYDVVVVSPRNHFLFTPLLPSTAVGTLEFRAIQEPVRTIPHVEYHQATVDKIDFQNSIVKCTDAFKKDGHCFEMTYDAIVLATGSTTNTFGVPGVENNEQVFFLKQLVDARSIRNRLIDCFERASSPGASLEEIKRLLTFIIVGGGPTSVEFAAELYDFLKSDVTRMYPDLHHHCKVTLVEASGHILGSFNESLVGYVDNLFKTRNVSVITNTAVKIVDGHVARLSDGQEIPFGLMVWSTGVKQVPLIDALSAGDVYKARNGRLFVDGHLRVLAPPLSSSTPTSSSSNATAVLRARAPVFALGDCAGDLAKPLPALAQVASQQGQYLAAALNKHGLEALWPSSGGANASASKAFAYQHLGAMASVGQWKGVYDSTNVLDSGVSGPPIKGFFAFVMWRAAYWTKQVSITNKILILMYWFKTAVFGRDISRF